MKGGQKREESITRGEERENKKGGLCSFVVNFSIITKKVLSDSLITFWEK